MAKNNQTYTATDDPVEDANTAKYNKFKATANDKALIRLDLIDLFDSVKAYNKQVSSLIDYGFTEKAIKVFFDAQYVNYNDELTAIFKGRNLQSVGLGSGTTPGTGDIPYLTVAQMEALINFLFNTSIAPTRSAAASDIRMSIRTRRTALTEAQRELNNEIAVFSKIGNSVSLLIKFYSIIKLQLQGYPYGQTRGGIELTLTDIENTLTNMSEDKIQDFMMILINFIVMKVPVGSDNNVFLKIKEIRTKGTNRYADLVTYLLNSITEDNILKYIRELLIQFLKNNIPLDLQLQFNDYVKDPTEEEKKDDPTIKKDEGRGETIADTTFLTLTEDLNNEQRDTLIQIITTLSQNEDIDVTEETFIKNVIFIFTNLKTIAVSNDTTSTRSSSSTSTGPATVSPSGSSLLTDILNKIKENSSLLLEIGNLILNPSPKIVATKITEILDSLKTTSIEPDVITKPDTTIETSSQDALSSLDSFFPTTIEQQDREAFLEMKYANENNNVSTSNDSTSNIPKSIKSSLGKMENILRDDGSYDTYFDISLNERLNKKEEVKTVEEVKLEEDEDIKILTEQIKQINNKNKTNIVKKKLQSVMNELRKKFGKMTLKKVFVIKRDGQPDLTFNSHYQLGQWLVANDTTAELTPIIVKYGLVRDYIAEDEKEENEFRYGPPDGGPPDGGPPDGGDPSGGRGYRRQGPSRRPRGRVTNSLTKRQYLLLVLIIALLASGAVSLEEVFKAGKDLNDNGTTTKPSPTDPTKPPITPVGPTKPDGTFNKISHNDFWDSVGLGTIIDTYNNMVDKYNALPAIEKKAYKSTVELYYDKFAKTINIPTLSELKQARARYDAIKKIYDSSDGLSFNQVSDIYSELNKSMTYLNKMTDKYLSFENKAFGLDKNKDDTDVTIDDVDADISVITKMNTSLSSGGGKNKAIVDSMYAVLSKGMRERIARKLKGEGDFSNGLIQENKRFVDFSLIKPREYPTGLGIDNPLVYRNKEYELMSYRDNIPNPKPYKVPSINRLTSISKQDKPILHNVIQLDNSFNYNSGNTLISQKLQNPNEMPTQFIKSRLFNPEYHLEQINKQQKASNTMNDEIRCGPYVGVKDNQYYQYANIQKKQNDELNNYPMTKEFKLNKPILPQKTIKNSRNVPNSYALK
jgi:hypothetical protein